MDFALDFTWRLYLICFHLPLMFICVELYSRRTMLHCTLICGLNLNLVCNVMNYVGLWHSCLFMFILWLVEVVLTLLKFILYISRMLYASISTYRGNSVKIVKFHIYVLLVFIQIYKHISRGSSLYLSNLGEFIHIIF